LQKELLKNLAPDSKATQLCLDTRLYHIGLSKDEANKQMFFTKECAEREDVSYILYYKNTRHHDMSVFQYLGQILQALSSDDVRHLVQAEDELSQAGHFIRIFPTPDSHHYHEFFEAPRYYNMLFDAWENRYNSNRAPGIYMILQTLPC
jgi:tubulin polyglutamylase TTLL4